MPAPHGHRAHGHHHHHGHNHGHQKAHHHGHNKVHHHKHHERIDHRQHTRPVMTGGVPSRPCTHHHMHHGHHHHHHSHSHHNHTLPVHHGDHQAPVPEKPNTVAEYARFEVLCLIASLALSMVLLYVGYRIGDRICNYENARSQHGRGHRHARIHREVIWSSADEKQGLLENEQVSGDSDEEEAVESQPVPIAAPQVARTRK
ncbi:hypothetical protein EC988_003287 [Linderina pennispora]|nr:hypothetical protein EC988_003287 [Linderina pennispora]